MSENFKKAKSVWGKLGDIPVNSDDNLDVDFYVSENDLTFTKGTDKFEIWSWIEETFDVSLVDLMFSNESVYISFLNKDKNFKEDKKIFTGDNAYSNAVKWGRENLDNFITDMIKYS